MADKKSQAANKPGAKEKKDINDPWIPLRAGLIMMAVLSLAFAGYIAWQVYPTEGLLNSILYGLLFGGSLWVVFLGFTLFNRFFRRK